MSKITIKPKNGSAFTIPVKELSIGSGSIRIGSGSIRVNPTDEFSLIGWQTFDLKNISKFTVEM